MKARYKLQKAVKLATPLSPKNSDLPQVQLKHGGYKEALFKEEWRAKRLEILKRDYQKCRNCSSNTELQVHHRQYHFSLKNQKFVEPWEYHSELLITLCKKCHNTGHNKYQVPIIKTH
jgi:5-methylcytosine-specific restriction endonuclease McrA